MPPFSLAKSPAFKRLKQLHSQPGDKSLMWYFDVGKCVLSLHPFESRKYGESRIQSIAEMLGKSGSYANELWKTRIFAKTYDRAEVKSLCQPDPETGVLLKWWHVIHLLPLNKEHREQYQSECLDNRWSSKELQRRIKAHHEPAGHGGRRFEKPEDTDAALHQLIRESQMWHRRYQEVWFAAEDPAIEFECRKRLSADTRKVIDEAVESLKILRHDIDQSLEILTAVLKAKKKPSRKKK